MVLQEFSSLEVGQWVGEESLGHQDQVDDNLHGVVWQVVGDDFFSGYSECDVPNVGEASFKDGRHHMGPVHHAAESLTLDHVPFQRRQENLWGVTEGDDAKGDRKGHPVHLEVDLRPAPGRRPAEAEDQDDGVDDEVGDRTPEAEPTDVAQALEEGARQQESAAHHRPAGQVERGVLDATIHQDSAQKHIQDAGHEELYQLSGVHDSASHPVAPDVSRDGDIGIPHPVPLALGSLVIQAVDKDLAGVTADVSHEDNEEQGSVASLKNGVRKWDDKHPLWKRPRRNVLTLGDKQNLH